MQNVTEVNHEKKHNLFYVIYSWFRAVLLIQWGTTGARCSVFLSCFLHFSPNSPSLHFCGIVLEVCQVDTVSSGLSQPNSGLFLPVLWKTCHCRLYYYSKSPLKLTGTCISDQLNWLASIPPRNPHGEKLFVFVRMFFFILIGLCAANGW